MALFMALLMLVIIGLTFLTYGSGVALVVTAIVFGIMFLAVALDD